MLALMGFLVIVALIYLVFRGKTNPVVAFALLPLIAALIAGFSVSEISEFISSGIDLTWQTAVLFIFSVTYFGIMNDAGLFDKMINKLLLFSRNKVTAVYVSTVLIAMVAHLDGSGATTFLITIPALLPIYLRLGLKPTSLLLLIASTAGVMNFVPWGGSTTRAASVIGMNPSELWLELIPMQVFGLVLSIGLALILPKVEKNKLNVTTSGDDGQETLTFTEEQMKLKRYNLIPYNAILTIALIVMLFTVPDVPMFVIFMIGVAIALPLNYRTLEEQNNEIKAHAPSALMMATILLSAGVFLGVLSESGMIEQMAYAVITVLPDFAGGFLHILISLFAAPIHLVIGTDPYYYALLPIVNDIVNSFGVSAKDVAIAMVIGESSTFAISAVVPSVYLAIGLAGVEYRHHLKYSFKYIWIISVLMILFGIVIGKISL